MLWRMDPTERFSNRADAYEAHRPGYPPALIDHLLAAVPNVGEVADIGAGTGISSRLFAERGLSVYAVEPNAAMRAAGATPKGLVWIDGTAESTGLRTASVDLVTCFQSFHWFDPEASLAELTRILRPGGALAAVWNERDERDGFTRAYGDLVRRISREHAAERRLEAAAHLAHPSLGSFRHAVFPNEQSLDLSGLVGRAASTSYLPATGPEHEVLVEGLEALFASWHSGGRVVLQYETHLYLAAR